MILRCLRSNVYSDILKRSNVKWFINYNVNWFGYSSSSFRVFYFRYQPRFPFHLPPLPPLLVRLPPPFFGHRCCRIVIRSIWYSRSSYLGRREEKKLKDLKPRYGPCHIQSLLTNDLVGFDSLTVSNDDFICYGSGQKGGRPPKYLFLIRFIKKFQVNSIFNETLSQFISHHDGYPIFFYN